jgi:hypothetical protein
MSVGVSLEAVRVFREEWVSGIPATVDVTLFGGHSYSDTTRTKESTPPNTRCCRYTELAGGVSE